MITPFHYLCIIHQVDVYPLDNKWNLYVVFKDKPELYLLCQLGAIRYSPLEVVFCHPSNMFWSIRYTEDFYTTQRKE